MRPSNKQKKNKSGLTWDTLLLSTMLSMKAAYVNNYAASGCYLSARAIESRAPRLG